MADAASPHILLVDDDLRLRGLLQTYLKREGFEITAAGNAEQMERALRDFPIDLMVLDLMLPGRGGLDICRELRAAQNSLPVIMLTAKGDDIDRILGLELGADDYLPKPCNPRELAARIRAVLRRRQSAPPGAPVNDARPVEFGAFPPAPGEPPAREGRRDRQLDHWRVRRAACIGDPSRRDPVARTAADAGSRSRAQRLRPQHRRRGVEAPAHHRTRSSGAALSADSLGRGLRVRSRRNAPMMPMPRSLFARTALLIAITIVVFAVVSWQAIIWTALVPTAEAAASLLTERAHAALAAQRSGGPLPEGARFESGEWMSMKPRYAGLAMRTYMERVRSRLAANLDSSDVRIQRYAAPSEIWVRTPEFPDSWLVLTWRIAGPARTLGDAPRVGRSGDAGARRRRAFGAPTHRPARGARGGGRAGRGGRASANRDVVGTRAKCARLPSRSNPCRIDSSELDEQRELMLGGISHDLRTPLARLRVAVELLDKDDAALTREISANIEEMDRMIGQFLHYARAGFREAPARASLDEITRQTLAIYASDERLRLELGVAEARRFAIDSVRHMLLNLVQNALEYGQPPVTVRTSATATEIRFEVRDRGAGLSAAQWTEALRPFHRLKDQPGGLHAGLGLAMVDRLVRVCGGSLDGRQIEGGFTVTVRLPAA